MNFLNKLERKFGRYAIPHLTTYIIITYVIGYLLNYAFPSALGYMTLDPYMIIFHGQVWRLVSWLLIPPSSLDIFTVIMLFFYYSIGSSLERAWGDFRYNVYIFFGIIMTIIGAFLLFVFTGFSYFGIYGLSFSTYYISLSIFLGFAMSFPDMQVMLYFLIPIKMKYMAVVYVVIVAIDFFRGSIVTKVAIVFSLASVIIFFFGTRNYSRYNPRERKRKNEFRKAMSKGKAQGYANGAKHKCAVCGRTELDSPELEFRYCSKCNGNYEYCQNHLFTHEHIK